jgi:hypothetical protein
MSLLSRSSLSLQAHPNFLDKELPLLIRIIAKLHKDHITRQEQKQQPRAPALAAEASLCSFSAVSLRLSLLPFVSVPRGKHLGFIAGSQITHATLPRRLRQINC